MLRALVLSMLLLSTLPAVAQTSSQGSANRQPLDANHDGQIDRSELQAGLQQMKARRAQREQTRQPSQPAEDSSGG